MAAGRPQRAIILWLRLRRPRAAMVVRACGEGMEQGWRWLAEIVQKEVQRTTKPRFIFKKTHRKSMRIM